MRTTPYDVICKPAKSDSINCNDKTDTALGSTVVDVGGCVRPCLTCSDIVDRYLTHGSRVVIGASPTPGT